MKENRQRNPEHLPLKLFSLLQRPFQPFPSACLALPKPLPLGIRPPLGIVILSFVIISSLILLFYFLALISPSVSFHR